MPEVLGTIYVKKDFHTIAGNDGIEECVWGLPFPPYFVPKRYWMRARVAGTTEVASLAIQEYRLSGRYGIMERDFITDATPPSAGQQFLTDMVEEFLPHEPGSVMDNTQDTQQDVGLTGSGVVPVGNQEFFNREIELGLPKHALVTDADLIRYMDRFDTKGRIPRDYAYEQAHLLAFSITTEDKINMPVNTEDDAIFGQAANAAPQLENLLEAMLSAIQSDTVGVGDLSFDIGRDPDQVVTILRNWQSASFGEAHVASGTTLTNDFTITVEVDVMIPAQRSGRLIVRAS